MSLDFNYTRCFQEYPNKNDIIMNNGKSIITVRPREDYNSLIDPFRIQPLYVSSTNMNPKIVDVNMIVPDKVVEITFLDGTKVKSVCKEPDVFSLEQAISICIAKKIMGGSGKYNKAVKFGIKVYEDKLKREASENAERERIEKRREKRKANKERRIRKLKEEEAARLSKEKEDMIEIQKEAYLRAMKEMNKKEN